MLNKKVIKEIFIKLNCEKLLKEKEIKGIRNCVCEEDLIELQKKTQETKRKFKINRKINNLSGIYKRIIKMIATSLKLLVIGLFLQIDYSESRAVSFNFK